MKKNILSTITSIFVLYTTFYGQDVAECEKVASFTYQAIKEKTAEPILKYLSNDFTIAGQTGEIAKMILPQLFSQLEVIDFKKINETQTEFLTLEYETTFEKIGKKTSTFIFNKDNQLMELKLLEMEVKTMKNETKVEKNENDFFVVPFKLCGQLIVVEASVNGIKRNFIVDNGSPKLILNNQHKSRKEEPKIKSTSSVKGVGGNINNMDIEKIEKFDFAGILLNNEEVLSMDLKHIEKGLKTDLYGLIGFEIYKDYDLLFDYVKNEITFIKPEKTTLYIENRFKKEQMVEVPIEMNKHIASVKASIDGKQYSFGIDCGAEANLINSELFDAVKNQLTKVKTDKLRGADKNTKKVKSGNLNSMRIGLIEFKNTRTVFGDISPLNNGYGLNSDGLIGYEILSKQPTLLSYTNKKIIFFQ